MTAAGWIEIAVYLVLLTVLTPVIGGYMARVFTFEPVFLDRLVGPVERADLPRARGRPASVARTGRATRSRY